MNDVLMIAAVSLIVGFAGFVDSIAGGGGIISLPAYFLTGMPPHMCYGTNKLSAACGSVFAVGTYMRHGAVNLKIALIAAAGSFVGSTIGSRVVMLLDGRVLQLMLVVLLPLVAIFIFVKKIGGEEDRSATLGSTKLMIFALLAGVLVGGYDGIFGPGTGTIAALAFTTVLRFDLRTATGNAKVLNLASNVAACVTFILAGAVDFRYAVPSAVCNIIGSILGSQMAVRRGSGFIRPVMLCVIVLLIGKVAWDLLRSFA
ncbi:MAG: TSUP family transporter [Anaerovoracaceae bacterium]